MCGSRMALILKGDEVEVCNKQVGFVGSYYAACRIWLELGV